MPAFQARNRMPAWRRTAVALTVSLLAVPLAAHAESFTFKTTGKNIDRVQLPAATEGGRPAGAGVSAVETDTTYLNGKVLHSSGKCASWILPPGSQFGSNQVCTYTGANGDAYQVNLTCEAPPQGPNCWGKLVGTGGAFKGRTGAFTLQGGANGSTGAGLWND
jgi:hypothetical protein